MTSLAQVAQLDITRTETRTQTWFWNLCSNHCPPRSTEWGTNEKGLLLRSWQVQVLQDQVLNLRAAQVASVTQGHLPLLLDWGSWEGSWRRWDWFEMAVNEIVYYWNLYFCPGFPRFLVPWGKDQILLIFASLRHLTEKNALFALHVYQNSSLRF